jgi:hypothetical protein
MTRAIRVDVDGSIEVIDVNLSVENVVAAELNVPDGSSWEEDCDNGEYMFFYVAGDAAENLDYNIRASNIAAALGDTYWAHEDNDYLEGVLLITGTNYDEELDEQVPLDIDDRAINIARTTH